MPPCRLRWRKFWKFDYEMVHSEVYLNKNMWSAQRRSLGPYICLPCWLSKYNINIENCSFCMFSLFNFSSIFPGTGKNCPHVRTRMLWRVRWDLQLPRHRATERLIDGWLGQVGCDVLRTVITRWRHETILQRTPPSQLTDWSSRIKACFYIYTHPFNGSFVTKGTVYT